MALPQQQQRRRRPGREYAIFTLLRLLLLLLLHVIIMFMGSGTAAQFWKHGRASDESWAWQEAHATYYTDKDALGSMEGACGYGDLYREGYGINTAALSVALFGDGDVCGACYQLRCVDDAVHCHAGATVTVTATDFCPPNYALPADPAGGGRCNPPLPHLLLRVTAFEKIALWSIGSMHVQMRRVKCSREGGVRFAINGGGYFISVVVSNVGGDGAVESLRIKGSSTGWLGLARIWGQVWHLSADLRGQPLSFELTTSDGRTLTSYSVAPRDWQFGRVYQGKQFP